MSGLRDMADSVAKMGKKVVDAPTGEASAIKAKSDNVKEYMDAVADKAPEPKAPTANSNADKLNSKSKYGDRPGEQRINVQDMVKPLTKYHKGTAFVPKTGPAVLKKGEAVIPAEHNPANPASAVYGSVPGMVKPKKEIDHMVHRKAKSGGHIVTHHFTEPGHYKPEDHVMSNMDQLHDHIEEHMGTPNPGEAEANMGQSGIGA